MQDEFKRLQAVVRTLAKSVSLTSTDAATAWNQAASLPLRPSDTSPYAAATGAVALLHGNTAYNFNDNSSAADNNIDITASRRRRRHQQQHHQLYL